MYRTRSKVGIPSLLLGVMFLGFFAGIGTAQQSSSGAAFTPEDRKAKKMLKDGIELLEMNQMDRGLKLLSSSASLFPKSPIRFDAYLALANHFIGVSDFNTAIGHLRQIDSSAQPELQAQAFCKIGQCYYESARYNQAFVALRQVIKNFPTSESANHAHYYTGLCYFRQKRWAKAAEAFEKVGTNVPDDATGERYAEIKQRLYVKIADKDIIIQTESENGISVVLNTSNGDQETVPLVPLGRGGEHHVASIETQLGTPVLGDGTLQVFGGDTVKAEYVDKNTQSGKLNQTRKTEIRMVSTATVEFTDGSYKESTQGVSVNENAFIRLRDLDLDTSDSADQARVTVLSRFRPPVDPDDPAANDLANEEIIYSTRDKVDVTLTETASHSGIFIGVVIPQLLEPGREVQRNDDILSAAENDRLRVEFLDVTHINGTEPRSISASARCLSGQMQDVKVIIRKVGDEDLLARKNLVEAKTFLELSRIFKRVGLEAKASEKAVEGLVRVDDIITKDVKLSLDRDVVEDAFRVKWELLLIQDKLTEAISVCRMLLRLYPDSPLVDQALFKIAVARQENKEYPEALRLLRAITALPKSALKPEAQFTIASIYEQQAMQRAEESGRPPSLKSALSAYLQCAERYPTSSFAGDSLAKICNFYISTQDYNRAIELLDRIFQDYPYAGFLDQMLMKWALVSYKMGDYDQAHNKVEQLLSEYPGSELVKKATKFLKIIEKKMG